MKKKKSLYWDLNKHIVVIKIANNDQSVKLDLRSTVYGPSSLHHLHQYLGGNEGFKAPSNRYHPHYSHEYNGSHHHPPSSYTETFLNYGRLSSHDAPTESRSQELARIPYAQETEGIGREREASSILYDGVQRAQLPAAPTLSQPTLLDATTTSSKIEQTSYACLGVGSCVCWISLNSLNFIGRRKVIRIENWLSRKSLVIDCPVLRAYTLYDCIGGLSITCRC